MQTIELSSPSPLAPQVFRGYMYCFPRLGRVPSLIPYPRCLCSALDLGDLCGTCYVQPGLLTVERVWQDVKLVVS